MPGKREWSERAALEGPVGSARAERVPGHEVEDRIADLELDLGLTTPLDLAAGEPVEIAYAKSYLTPLDASFCDDEFCEEGNVFVGISFYILFLIVIVCSGLAVFMSGAICFFWLGIAVLTTTWIAILVGRMYKNANQ